MGLPADLLTLRPAILIRAFDATAGHAASFEASAASAAAFSALAPWLPRWPPRLLRWPPDYRASLQCRPQKYEVGPVDETEQLEADETTYQRGNKRDARLEEGITTN